MKKENPIKLPSINAGTELAVHVRAVRGVSPSAAFLDVTSGVLD